MGRPRKDKIGKVPIRVDKKSEEYYLDRALQTPGLLNGADYMKALERLMEIRTDKTRDARLTPEQRNDRLKRLLGKATQEETGMRGKDSQNSVELAS